MRDNLVTIDYIVKNWMLLKGASSLANFDTYKQICLNGLRETNIRHTTYMREVILKVNEVNQVLLPSDCIDYISVGVYVEGELFELDYNDKLGTETLNTATTPLFTEHASPPVTKGIKYARIRNNGAGQCKVDETNRVIVFRGNFKSVDISLKYVSSGIPETGEVYVEQNLREVLVTYLEWQSKEFDDNIPVTVKDRAENKHGDAIRRYYATQNAMGAEEILTLFRNGIHQGIKR